MIRNTQPDITAVDANKILAQVGLLSDSKDRPGLPLRKLLREGKIPPRISNREQMAHSPLNKQTDKNRGKIATAIQ